MALKDIEDTYNVQGHRHGVSSRIYPSLYKEDTIDSLVHIHTQYIYDIHIRILFRV
jgi:hypothetical protein